MKPKTKRKSAALSAKSAKPSKQKAVMPANPMMQFITPAAQSRWMGPGISFYTPQRIEQLFRQALSGDLQSQWELFDLMEATAPRLSKNLNQLKDAVVGCGISMMPFKPKGAKEATDTAKKKAQFADEALQTMHPAQQNDENDFEDTIRDVMDARGKGHSILENLWEFRALSMGVACVPRCTRWVHPCWYGYARGSADADLKLKPGEFSEYMSTITVGPVAWNDFPEHKFITAICKNKTGHPLGSAMLWVLSFWWAAANFSAEWFLNLAQIFGQPFRWATYDPNMTPGDQNSLASMLANMGSQAWAMFPAGTEMDFKESMKNAGDYPQMALLNYFDKQCDLVILRQTLSSDVSEKSGSRAQGEVHERILDDVEIACARWTCKTLQPLVRSIIELNFPDDSEMPYLSPPVEEEDEAKDVADLLKVLSDAGFEPTDDAVNALNERIGFNIQRKQPTDGSNENEDANLLSAKDAGARGRVASDHVNAIAAKRAGELGNALRSNFAGALQIVKDSTSPADATAKLKAYFADWRPTQIVRALEPALQECAAHGAVESLQSTKTKE
jgi:phage gp29-like protein